MKSPLIYSAVALAISLLSAPTFAEIESAKLHLPLDQALELYQLSGGRTVLRSPNLPPLPEFNASILSSQTNGMKVVLENELSNHGIEFIPLGKVFALAVEANWKNSTAGKYVTNLKPGWEGSISPSNSPASDQDRAEAAIPPGTIDFRGADLNQVLDLYAMLVNRDILRPSQLASPTFKLRTSTPLTKVDAVYMMEILLALNGIASVKDGTHFVQVVPLTQVANLKLEAPRRNPGDPLLDPKTLRSIGYAQIVPGKPVAISRQGAVNDLVAYYAELTGRTVVPSQPVGGIPVVFRAQTPLTKPELLYALEKTLALSGLAIIDVDDKTIRAGFAREQNQAKK